MTTLVSKRDKGNTALTFDHKYPTNNREDGTRTTTSCTQSSCSTIELLPEKF